MTKQNTAVLSLSGHEVPAEPHTNTSVFSTPPTVAINPVPAPWGMQSVARIYSLADLDHNWDSYGAAPIKKRAMDDAQRLVQVLAHITGVLAPSTGGTPEGHVGLSWDSGNWSLDVEVLGNGRIDYVYLDERDEANNREATTSNLEDLLELLTQWS